MAYAGLESIFQNEGPLSGGMYQGEREAMGTADSLLGQQKQILDNQNAATMNPLNAQFRQGEIAAQAPALSLAQTNATRAAGTLNSDIEAGNSKNRAQISSDQFKTLTTMGHTAGVLGTMLLNTPEGLPRQTAAMSFMQQNNIDPNGKVGQYIINNPPEKLIEVSKKISQLSDSYIQAQNTADISARSHIQGIKEQGKNALALEQQQFEHGKYDKNKLAISINTELLKVKTPREAAEKLALAADIAEANNDPVSAQQYRQRAQEARQRVAEDYSNQGTSRPGADLPALGVQTTPRPTATAPIAPAPVQQSKPQLAPQDQAAIDWARANPRDPRSAAILKLHGM